MRGRSERTNTIISIDAVTDAVRVLAPQLGSNRSTIQEGSYDRKRLTNLNPTEILWLAYFLDIPDDEGGQFAKTFCNNYMDLKMSQDGQRAKLIVKALSNIGSSETDDEPLEVDRRNLLQKYVTQRNQGPSNEP
jgi:hypothetical protein